MAQIPTGFEEWGPHPSLVFVDENPAAETELLSQLRQEGYAVKTYTTVQEALTHLRMNRAAVIMASYEMEGMNGLDFLNRAAALYPESIRILLSNSADRISTLRAIAWGLIHHHIIRPTTYLNIRELVREAFATQQSTSERYMREIIAMPDGLPSPPEFHTVLRRLLSKDTSSLHDIATELSKDPILTAKLLRVANSAYYGTRNEVTSVQDAVVFIGTQHIANLVMAIEAFHNVARLKDPRAAHVIEQLWRQSLRRASIAKDIAAHWPGLPDPSLAYTASIVQDIGFVLRLSYDTQRFFAFQKLHLSGEMSMQDAEAATFPIQHPEAGAALFRFWNLPASIVHAVAAHHSRGDLGPVEQILQIADILECGDGSIAHDPELDPEIVRWAEKLKISPPRKLVIERHEAAGKTGAASAA
jgi:HD-like signal output (HDOD) protein/CheY-like chemotaxis protein